MTSSNKLKKYRFFLCFCALIIMTVIFLFSAQPSAQRTNTSDSTTIFIAKIFIRDFKSLTDYEKYNLVHTLNIFVRKGAHFSIYMLLSVFVTLFFLSYKKIKLKNVFLYTILFCVVYAATDELHQYFVPGRSCQITDVMIDGCGAIFGFVVLIGITKILKLILSRRS